MRTEVANIDLSKNVSAKTKMFIGKYEIKISQIKYRTMERYLITSFTGNQISNIYDIQNLLTCFLGNVEYTKLC